MLKWAVTPRSNSEVFEHNQIHDDNNGDLLTLQTIVEQNKLPCLIRLVNNDMKNSIDNYCLLLCETNNSYLIGSNETEQFSIPISFDGLFARVEHGITRYNILQSIHSLQSHFKTSFPYTHFTTLQPYMAYHNSSLCRIDPGTLLEPRHRSMTSSTSLSSSSIRLRTLFTSLPHSLNKHLLSNHSQKRSIKKQILPNEQFQVKSNVHNDVLIFKSDSVGLFVPVCTQLSSINSHRRSSRLSYPSNQIQGLYTTYLLTHLIDQYPLITDLIVSRTLEEYISTTNGYPFRRLTFHRFVENHSRFIAFDIKSSTFFEIDKKNYTNIYAIKYNNTFLQRYQTQLKWCLKYLTLYHSQIKTIVQSSNMFIQTIPFPTEQRQDHPHRRSSPFIKYSSNLIYTSQESIVPQISDPLLAKFYTISNPLKYEEKQQPCKEITRKNVRVHFNDSAMEKYFQSKQIITKEKHSNHQSINVETNDDEDNENVFQSTAL